MHEVRRPPGEHTEARGGHQLVVAGEQLGAAQRPGLVDVRDVPGHAQVVLVQAPARGEEVRERVTVDRRPRPQGHDAAVTRRVRVAAAVVDLAAGVPERHPRPPVGQPERRLRPDDHREPGGVEAAEDDAAPPGVVDGVEPDVGLQERPEPRDRRPAQGTPAPTIRNGTSPT